MITQNKILIVISSALGISALLFLTRKKWLALFKKKEKNAMQSEKSTKTPAQLEQPGGIVDNKKLTMEQANELALKLNTKGGRVGSEYNKLKFNITQQLKNAGYSLEVKHLDRPIGALQFRAEPFKS